MRANKWLLSSLLVVSPAIWAHGYLTDPTSRSYRCNQGSNINCAAVQYEPQSLEAPSGFPDSGPADGKIASAGISRFSNLDEQTSVRWAKTNINSGANVFTWKFTANHITRNFRYYITKQDWDPNQELTRNSFELTPFCTIDAGMTAPPSTVTHKCTVPNRTGYQVILGVWEVGNTANSFYNVIDVNVNGSGTVIPAAWSKEVGIIQPSVDLHSGDKVGIRVFDINGERTDLNTSMNIATDAQGEKNTWAHDLAQKINTAAGPLRAGQLVKNDTFNAVYGANTLYTGSSSSITRVEVAITQKDVAPAASFAVSGLQPSYVAISGKLTLTYTVSVSGQMVVESTVYDHAQTQKAYTSAALQNSARSFSLNLDNVSAGHYMLVVKGTDAAGKVSQTTSDFMVTTESAPTPPAPSGNYDYVFPANLSSYKVGTKVLQPKDGGIYQCRSAPYSGYCVQWKSSANGFEPGVGASWNMAWNKVG